jgi:hypothetical protein
VNNSVVFEATGCQCGSCGKNAVVKNSAAEFRVFLVHARTFFLTRSLGSASIHCIAIGAKNRARNPAELARIPEKVGRA